jgi:hypothetical protein
MRISGSLLLTRQLFSVSTRYIVTPTGRLLWQDRGSQGVVRLSTFLVLILSTWLADLSKFLPIEPKILFAALSMLFISVQF